MSGAEITRMLSMKKYLKLLTKILHSIKNTCHCIEIEVTPSVGQKYETHTKLAWIEFQLSTIELLKLHGDRTVM